MPTRAIVRLATPDEGPLLHTLFTESGKWEIEGLDWNRDMGPYWLIAEYNDIPSGCIMVRPGRPIGSLEMLCVPKLLPHRWKASVTRSLMYAGLASLKRSGSQLVYGHIPEGQESWKRVMQRRGATQWFDNGCVYLIRV